MDKSSEKLFDIFVRYFLIIIFGLGNLWIFYKIFSPITIFTFSFILRIFGDVSVIGNVVLFNVKSIEIVGACVAGAAYYLLFLLAMSVKTDIKTRIKIVGFTFVSFFVFNIVRLLVLTSLTDVASFEFIHSISWHFLSSVFVFLIWIGASKLFKLKSIPVYDDLKYIFGLTKKNSKRNKKHK